MDIRHWTIDSRNVKDPADVFVAVRGYHDDGHRFIPDAVARGARTIVAERRQDLPEDVEQIIVPDTVRYLRERLKAEVYPEIQDVTLIGITGTNGKTTICYLIYQLLNMLDIPCAYIGTIGFFCRGEKRPIPNTTPDTLLLYQLVHEAKSQGCQTIVLEVSSHSLEEGRLYGLQLSVAGFSNLTRDHLDFHKTMERYLEAKRKILQYLKPDGTMIVNRDDEKADAFLDPRMVQIGSVKERLLPDYPVSAWLNKEKSLFDVGGSVLHIEAGNEAFEVPYSLANELNAENFLMAAAAVHAYGSPYAEIFRLANQLLGAKGRFETYEVNQGIAVVDYAHNPDAIKKALDFYRPKAEGRLFCVLGCAGERDRGKRPMIGKMVTDVCDFTVFTNDDPHAEPPEQIMADILSGIENDSSKYAVEYNRHKAIFRVLREMQKGDIALILGKGHENYIVFANHRIPHNDGEVIREYLKEQ